MLRRARINMIRWLSSLVLACAPGLASAVMPTGSFDFTLGGNQSIWFGEIHNDENFCKAMWGPLEGIEHCDVEMAVDAQGISTG